MNKVHFLQAEVSLQEAEEQLDISHTLQRIGEEPLGDVEPVMLTVVGLATY